ncbi:hypothetical protein B0H13DRAFT_1888419 [Mycena leptocephala]|nr:hypothetical protein B0H13DRAFT_1888419 [Mycena leptocephala]
MCPGIVAHCGMVFWCLKGEAKDKQGQVESESAKDRVLPEATLVHITLMPNFANRQLKSAHLKKSGNEQIRTSAYCKIAGSSLLMSVVYCMAVLQPSMFGALYITWVDAIRGSWGRRGMWRSTAPAINALEIYCEEITNRCGFIVHKDIGPGSGVKAQLKSCTFGWENHQII